MAKLDTTRYGLPQPKTPNGSISNRENESESKKTDASRRQYRRGGKRDQAMIKPPVGPDGRLIVNNITGLDLPTLNKKRVHQGVKKDYGMYQTQYTSSPTALHLQKSKKNEVPGMHRIGNYLCPKKYMTYDCVPSPESNYGRKKSPTLKLNNSNRVLFEDNYDRVISTNQLKKVIRNRFGNNISITKSIYSLASKEANKIVKNPNCNVDMLRTFLIEMWNNSNNNSLSKMSQQLTLHLKSRNIHSLTCEKDGRVGCILPVVLYLKNGS
tara:strand:+ start:368 stop:1171 length:804 start_codon:yes stop_codon:yes gene_type:complete